MRKPDGQEMSSTYSLDVTKCLTLADQYFRKMFPVSLYVAHAVEALTALCVCVCACV